MPYFGGSFQAILSLINVLHGNVFYTKHQGFFYVKNFLLKANTKNKT